MSAWRLALHGLLQLVLQVAAGLCVALVISGIGWMRVDWIAGGVLVLPAVWFALLKLDDRR